MVERGGFLAVAVDVEVQILPPPSFFTRSQCFKNERPPMTQTEASALAEIVSKLEKKTELFEELRVKFPHLNFETAKGAANEKNSSEQSGRISSSIP